MELLKHGKTKDVYKLTNGNYLLKFKDTVTGNAATGESDPGGNQVVGTVTGVGSKALKVTKYFFEKLKELNIPTHYVNADVSKNEMEVKGAVMFGNGLEFVCRFIATGSFIRRFGMYCREGAPLDALFEATLKDDANNDPPVTEEILLSLGLLTKNQFEEIYKNTKTISKVVRDDLKAKGLILYDIKLEFGLINDKIVLIDEISAGNMRVYKDGKKLSYSELSDLIC